MGGCRREASAKRPLFPQVSQDYKAALASLRAQDLEELRSYRQPPAPVVWVTDVLCHMFHQEPGWENAKLLLQREDFYQVGLWSVFGPPPHHLPACCSLEVTHTAVEHTHTTHAPPHPLGRRLSGLWLCWKGSFSHPFLILPSLGQRDRGASPSLPVQADMTGAVQLFFLPSFESGDNVGSLGDLAQEFPKTSRRFSSWSEATPARPVGCFWPRDPQKATSWGRL